MKLKCGLSITTVLLSVALSSCAEPIPEGARIRVSRRTPPPAPKSLLVLNPVIHLGFMGEHQERDRRLNDSLVPVQLAGVTGVMTAAAWLCVDGSDLSPGLSLMPGGEAVIAPLKTSWIGSDKYSPSRYCDRGAATAQLQTLRVRDVLHPVAVTDGGQQAMILNYSRVTLKVEGLPSGRNRSMTAASFFCATQLGLADGLSLAPDANPRLSELEAVWDRPPGAAWTCDRFRVEDELATVKPVLRGEP